MFLGRVLSQLAGLLFHPFLSATRWILWTDFGTERWKYRHQWKHKSKVMALFWSKHQCKRTEYVWLLKCYYEGQQKWYFLCTVLLSCDETPNGIRNNPSWNEWLFELSYLELTWTFGMGKGHLFLESRQYLRNPVLHLSSFQTVELSAKFKELNQIRDNHRDPDRETPKNVQLADLP